MAMVIRRMGVTSGGMVHSKALGLLSTAKNAANASSIASQHAHFVEMVKHHGEGEVRFQLSDNGA